MHQAVIDNEAISKPKVKKLRAMLKTIRLSSRMRAYFKKVQIFLGAREHNTKEVPRLDMENRCNTRFTMIDSSYSLMESFQSLSNMSEHYTKFVTLTSIE